jgi:hypothetical protein
VHTSYTLDTLNQLACLRLDFVNRLILISVGLSNDRGRARYLGLSERRVARHRFPQSVNRGNDATFSNQSSSPMGQVDSVS